MTHFELRQRVICKLDPVVRENGWSRCLFPGFIVGHIRDIQIHQNDNMYDDVIYTIEDCEGWFPAERVRADDGTTKTYDELVQLFAAPVPAEAK